MKAFKALINPFEGPQRSVKIKFKFIFSLRTGSGWEWIIGLALLTPESNAPIAPTPEKIQEELVTVPESKTVGEKADTPKSPTRKDGKKRKESPSPTRKGKVKGKRFPFNVRSSHYRCSLK